MQYAANSLPVQKLDHETKRSAKRRFLRWGRVAEVRGKSFGQCIAERKHVNHETRHLISIDCTEVKTVSSAELSELIQLHLESRAGGSDIELVNVSESVHQVLRITRIDRLVCTRNDAGHPTPKPCLHRPK